MQARPHSLSEDVVDIAPARFGAPGSALTAQRHQLVSGVGVVLKDDPTGSALDPGRLPGCDHVTQQERKLCVIREAAQFSGNCGKT